jgi:tight adherence protein C
MFILTIHAGLSPVQAVRELAVTVPIEVRGGFEAVVHRLDRGEPFAQAVQALPECLGVGMVAFADLIAGADRYGVPIGPVLESLAADVRATRRRLDETDARRLPVRLSFPLVICTLPSFVLLAIAPALIAALSSLSLDL